MKAERGKLPGVMLLIPEAAIDRRGFFMESYNRATFAGFGMDIDFVQDNHSLSVLPGTLRGLHYQLHPKAQTKLVRVTAGAIFDVVVDIRQGSPSYGQWEGYELSAENRRQLLVPRGFAHGFCTLMPRTEVQYKVDAYFSPEHDKGITWNDPAVGIVWPTAGEPILSDKDARHPMLSESENNFVYEG